MTLTIGTRPRPQPCHGAVAEVVALTITLAVGSEIPAEPTKVLFSCVSSTPRLSGVPFAASRCLEELAA